MGLFDRYIAVDWSASNTPKRGADSIWMATGTAGGRAIATVNHPTRHAAETGLARALARAVRTGRRTLVGFDFPFGYPAGFAAALGVTDWDGVWCFLAQHVTDDEHNTSNRFAVAATINRTLGARAPFWGRPAHLALDGLASRKEVTYRSAHAPEALAEWRTVEATLRHAHRYPQPAYKLAGSGSVGSQSIVGIPVVRRLRHHPELERASAVWPFEPWQRASVVHAEIWPSLVDFGAEAGSCRDERQVRAVVRAWRELDAAGELGAQLAAAPESAAVRREEGWVLGVLPG